MEETPGRKKIRAMDDETLSCLWVALEDKGAVPLAVTVRGCVLDELNDRLGDTLFQEWMASADSYGDRAIPKTYLDRLQD